MTHVFQSDAIWNSEVAIPGRDAIHAMSCHALSCGAPIRNLNELSDAAIDADTDEPPPLIDFATPCHANAMPSHAPSLRDIDYLFLFTNDTQ